MPTSKSFSERERHRLNKLSQYQLPPFFRRIGAALAIFSFLFLLFNKFALELPELRTVGRYGLLLGMLLISISKEAVEDELITKLRMQSYSFAFIIGIGYTLALPFIDYLVDLLFTQKEAVLKDTGDFLILWMLLSVQVFCFEILKRAHR